MTAERVRASIEQGFIDPPSFRAALEHVPAAERDAWLDRVLGLGELPDDAPDLLPRGCVPYLPSPVDAVLQIVERIPLGATDVFVDVGSGVGRVGALVHLLTGAAVINLEIQPALVARARDLTARLRLGRVSCVEGDAAKLARFLTTGTVFFLYCPFSGERLANLVSDLEAIARARTIHVCCLDVPLPSRPWLAPVSPLSPVSPGLEIYRSTVR